MSVSLVVAVAENRAIGLKGTIPWHLPDDLKLFRKITMGHTIVMGRKTWHALPHRPLDGRINLVLSSAFEAGEGFEVVRSLDDLLVKSRQPEELMIVGGATLYLQTMPFAETLYLTRVHSEFEADTFFPEFDMEEWHCIDSVYHPSDELHSVDFTFQTLVRK